jgi:hypothetical protein
VFAPANGVQAMAHAFATVATVAELSALLDVAEQLAAAAEKRLSKPTVKPVVSPVVEKPVAKKPAAEKPVAKKPAAEKPVSPKVAAQTVEEPKAVAPKATPKADGLAGYRKLQAECKALGVSAKGKADELKARIAAAKAAPKAESQPAGRTPKAVNRLQAMADLLGVKLSDLTAAAELAGVKLS